MEWGTEGVPRRRLITELEGTEREEGLRLREELDGFEVGVLDQLRGQVGGSAMQGVAAL